jgi:hypothetical protein
MRSIALVGILSVVGCATELTIADSKNMEPAATISAPVADTVFFANEVIEFLGTASDGNGVTDIQAISWTSDVEGELGSPELIRLDEDGTSRFSAILSAGSHLITFTVTDFQGATSKATANIAVGIDNPEPTVEIVEPDNFETRFAGTPITFIGEVEDPQFSPDTVFTTWSIEEQTTFAVVFTDDMQATAEGETQTTWDNPVIGNYVVTLEGENDAGYVGVHDIAISVGDPNDVDTDGDGHTTNQGDCNDDDAYTYPGAVELEDGIDNDCDGLIDEGTDLYDDDGDGYCEHPTTPCSDGSLNGDCDDTLDYVNPGEEEVCGDIIDNDCDTIIDSEDALGCQVYYYDNDSDGYGATDVEPQRCICSSEMEWTAQQAGDCNDYDNLINPGAVESQDRLDNNCNSLKDETTEWYDDDGDGYCEAVSPDTCTLQSAPSVPWGGGDCDDTDDLVNPGATEDCGTTWDDNCDNDTNDLNALNCNTYYSDADGDNYPDLNDSQCVCNTSGDYKVAYPTSLGHDCHDGNSDVSPAQTSYFNTSYTTPLGGQSYDYNCSGTEERYYQDSAKAGNCDSDYFIIYIGCKNETSGWYGSNTAPACGQSKDFVTGCDDGYILLDSCSYLTDDYTQVCR